MSTREWGQGYDEGYMKGWNDAMDEKPAEADEPVAYIEHHKAGDNLVWDNPGANSSALYTSPQAQQEHLAWKNAAIRLGEDLSSVGPDGYYDMTAEQWLDWAMDQRLYGKNFLPAQRTWVGLTPEERDHIWNTVGNSDAHGDVDGRSGEYVMDAIEAKLRSKNEDRN